MKMLHVISGMQKAAGTSVFAGEICNTIAEMGHDVTLLVKNLGEDCYPVCEKVKVLDEVQNWNFSPFNVVHVHALWDPWLTQVARAARAEGCKVVWSPHGMLTPWAMHNKRMKKQLGWWLYQRAALKKADLLHATAESEVEDIRRMGLKNQVVVAPLGVRIEPNIHCTLPPNFSNSKTLLFVSRVQKKKGLPMLLEAWARLPRELTGGWVIRIVGPDQDNHTTELKAQAERLGLVGEVQFVGPKYGVDLSWEYASADLFVLPTHSENFGSVVIESLAHGLPVICTKGAPWRELATYQCGWWIDIGVQPLVDVLSKAMGLTVDERKAMGCRGRALVKENYSWSAIAEKVLNKYNDMCVMTREGI